MRFDEALKVIENNNHRIGLKTEKGGIIDELIIVPTDVNEREAVIRSYLFDFNAQKAIAPFFNSEVEVIAVIDKEKIVSHGVFLYQSI